MKISDVCACARMCARACACVYLVPSLGVATAACGSGGGALCACAFHKDKSYVGNMPSEGTSEEK